MLLPLNFLHVFFCSCVWHISSKNQGKSQFVQFIYSVNTIHIINSLISMFFLSCDGNEYVFLFLAFVFLAPQREKLHKHEESSQLWEASTWNSCSFLYPPSLVLARLSTRKNSTIKKRKRNQLNSSFQIVIGLDNKKQ